MLGLDDVVLQVSIEAVLVELVEVGRVQDRHVDIAGAEQVVDQYLFAIAAKFVERPDLLGRAQAAVKSVKAFDPTLAVLVFPVLWVGVPEMHVTVDNEDVVPIMTVHLPLLRLRGAWQARRDRKRHWPPARRERCGRRGNKLRAARPAAAGRQDRQSIER